MSKKVLLSAATAIALAVSSPIAASADPYDNSNVNITYLAKEYRSKNIDGFFKCMLGRSGYSFLGYGVSLTCHRDGNQWYFNYWDR